MKVLVVNDANPCTWYHGMAGKVFDVSYILNAHIFVEGVDNDGPAGVHVPDGVLLYTEEEIKDLMKRVDQAEADKKLAVADAYRLQDENIMLLQQIERTIDEQQVALPHEVAKALDRLACRSFEEKQWGFFNIVHLKHEFLDPNARILKDYFRTNGYLDFARALIFGYTIEESFDDLLKKGIKHIIDTHDDRFGLGLYFQIANFVREMYSQQS